MRGFLGLGRRIQGVRAKNQGPVLQDSQDFETPNLPPFAGLGVLVDHSMVPALCSSRAWRSPHSLRALGP